MENFCHQVEETVFEEDYHVLQPVFFVNQFLFFFITHHFGEDIVVNATTVNERLKLPQQDAKRLLLAKKNVLGSFDEPNLL